MPDWKTRLYEWLYRKYSLRTFDRILCVSHADYEFLSSSGDGKERLRLHLNGIAGAFGDPRGSPQRGPESKGTLATPGE